MTDCESQGRAGLVAWRRSRGGVGALGKAFYKGGFEPRMNKREASLILSLKYDTLPLHYFVQSGADQSVIVNALLRKRRSERPIELSCS